MAGYRIVDEPRPSRWNSIAVNPFWIFLAALLGGITLGWAWFVVNGFAFGSPSRKREITLVVVGALGLAALLFLAAQLAASLPTELRPYLQVVFIAYKLAIVYLLHLTQSRGFELYQHFGGRVQNGLPVLIALVVLRPKLSEWLGTWAGVLL